MVMYQTNWYSMIRISQNHHNHHDVLVVLVAVACFLYTV